MHGARGSLSPMPERKKPSRASTPKPSAARSAARKPAATKRTTAARPAARPAARAGGKTSATTRKATPSKPAPRSSKAAPAKGAPKRSAQRPNPRRRAEQDEILDPLDLEGILDDDELDEGSEDDDISEEQAPALSAVASRAADLDGTDAMTGATVPEVFVAEGPFVSEGHADTSQPLLVRFDDREVPPPSEVVGVERPREELLAGVAALLLSLTVFLPWFGPKGLEISGWEGGLWGPIIFFAALAVVAIVGLRRAGVPVTLPVDHAAIIEAVGWMALLGGLASRFFGIEVAPTDYNATRWVFAPMALGAILAAVASKISTGSPFVLRPGWFSGMGGKIGAAVLAVALLAGVAFGVTGTATPGKQVTGPRAGSVKTFNGTLPPCAKAVKFPTPSIVKLQQSFQLPEDNCNVTFTSTQSLAKVIAAYRAALKTAGWKFTAIPSPNAMSFQLTAPRCGTLALNALTLPSTERAARAKVTGFAVFSKTCTGAGVPQRGRTDQPPS